MLFRSGDIWNQCKVGKDVVVSLADCENGKGHTYTCTGATVTQFTLSIEAESLTCLDNVVVEFMQLIVAAA